MKFNDTLYLTQSQVKKIAKGWKVRVLRDKKWFTIGLKTKSLKQARIEKQIAKLKSDLAKLKGKDATSETRDSKKQ